MNITAVKTAVYRRNNNIFERLIQNPNNSPGGQQPSRLIPITLAGRPAQIGILAKKIDTNGTNFSSKPSSSSSQTSSSSTLDDRQNLDITVTESDEDSDDSDSDALHIVDDEEDEDSSNTGDVTPLPVSTTNEEQTKNIDHCYRSKSIVTVPAGIVASPKFVPVLTTGGPGVLYLIPKFSNAASAQVVPLVSEPTTQQTVVNDGITTAITVETSSPPTSSTTANYCLHSSIGNFGASTSSSKTSKKRIRKAPRFDKQSEQYKKFRERNNSAVKKSRSKAKLMAKVRCSELEVTIELLKRENERLLQLLEESNQKIEYLSRLAAVKDESSVVPSS